MLDDLAGWVIGLGFGIATIVPGRSLIHAGRRERKFQLRWLRIGGAVFLVGIALAVVDAVLGDKPLW